MIVLMKDEIIDLTDGEYEERHIVARVRIICELFNYSKIIKEYIDFNCLNDKLNAQDFIKFLIRKKYVEEIEIPTFKSIQITDYGKPILYNEEKII